MPTHGSAHTGAITTSAPIADSGQALENTLEIERVGAEEGERGSATERSPTSDTFAIALNKV